MHTTQITTETIFQPTNNSSYSSQIISEFIYEVAAFSFSCQIVSEFIYPTPSTLSRFIKISLDALLPTSSFNGGF